jgi:hypothetical protein
MTDEELKIARAFVACGRWRWMPGMMTEGWRLTCVSLHDGAWSATSTLAHREYHYPTLPDLNDPCTRGGILQVVANAHGVSIDDVHVLRTTGRVWSVWIFRPDDSSYRVATHLPSRVEALLRALQAAPEVQDE